MCNFRIAHEYERPRLASPASSYVVFSLSSYILARATLNGFTTKQIIVLTKG
jgi:hypothetical protein